MTIRSALRARVGRWLLRPEADRVVAHCVTRSVRFHEEGHMRDAQRWDDAAFGADLLRSGGWER